MPLSNRSFEKIIDLVHELATRPKAGNPEGCRWVKNDKGRVTIEQIADLRFSPQMAKKLTGIMVDQIRLYEELFGEIPLPKE